MLYKEKQIMIEELEQLLTENPKDDVLIQLKKDYDYIENLLLNSTIFERNHQQYYKK